MGSKVSEMAMCLLIRVFQYCDRGFTLQLSARGVGSRTLTATGTCLSRPSLVASNDWGGRILGSRLFPAFERGFRHMCLTVLLLVFLAFAMFSCVHMRFTG